ncbi:MAG: BCD family MFS transporter [Gammaproteobacteria bacterium]
MSARQLGWPGIVRLGLVQTALGAIVVLTTSTLNRVMVVELALAASLPGALVALHYGIQLARPRLGYGSDVGGRRTPWIIGGMALLALGGIGAACATALMAKTVGGGIAMAVVAFVLIGLGVGAAGTSLLVLLASRVAPARRPAAATVVWTMMIAGFVITAASAGHFLDPFSFERLIGVTSVVSISAFVVSVLAVGRLEHRTEPVSTTPADTARAPFRAALAEVWAEPRARLFTVFVFVSMLGYSAQDLILEPFAGLVFGYSPGASTQLAGTQHGGVLAGMLLVALVSSLPAGRRLIGIRGFTLGGCLASALALALLALAGLHGPPWPLAAGVFALGLANGCFAVAAIGAMMTLAGEGHARREGVRMGLWGAAQAIAFGVGGFAGALGVDLLRQLGSAPATAYAVVFALEGLLFVAAAALAARVMQTTVVTPARCDVVTSASEYAIGMSRS